MKIVLITGGFDPIHSGHISYIKAAKNLGDFLIVGLNSDNWLIRKKGKAFLPLHERQIIIDNLRYVDMTLSFNDDDNSAKNAIEIVRQLYPADEIIFANGGDRTSKNIPEMDIKDSNISFIFGVGGENKLNSSSWILKNYLTDK